MTVEAHEHQHAASLLDADPGLASMLGWEVAWTVGHERVLPVHRFPAGAWAPLGLAARRPHGFVVLEGLLSARYGDRQCLAGPGDMVVPWGSDECWWACTPVRLAEIGDAYELALLSWPLAIDRLLARAVRPGSWTPGDGPPEARIGELLWRLAARYGAVAPSGVSLPLALDTAKLATLVGLSETDAGAAVAELSRRGEAVRCDPGWLLSAIDSGDRGALLHARAAVQMAAARDAGADLLAIGASFERRRRPPAAA